MNKILLALATTILFLAPNLFAENAANKKNLSIVFGVYRPPYIFENKNKGLDYDLAVTILEKRGFKITAFHSPNERALQEIALGKVDGAIGVAAKTESPSLCYTNPILYYDNVVITKAKNKIKIGGVSDLKNQPFLAFSKATRYLGNEYAELVHTLKKDTDTSNQMVQNRLFWSDKVPVIILDLNVFKYYQNSLKNSLNTKDEVVVHRIFEMKSNSRVAVFKDKKVCEEFNTGLNEIKASGEYQKLLDKYLKTEPVNH